MIYILHGENLALARSLILNLQKKLNVEERREFGLLDITPSQLLEAVTTFDLFGNPPFVVFDITNMGRTNVDDYIKVLYQVPSPANLIILAAKELTASNAFIKAAPDLKAKVVLSASKPTANVFKFLDSLFSQNRSSAYTELRNLIVSGEDHFYLFSMTLYQLRNIAHAKFNSPRFNKLAPFVKSKAKKLAERFSQEQIKEFYSYFYSLEKDSKTGKISIDVAIPLAVEKVLNV